MSLRDGQVTTHMRETEVMSPRRLMLVLARLNGLQQMGSQLIGTVPVHT